MLAIYKETEIVVDVEPFYLYGRIVAYVGKLYRAVPYNGVAVKWIGSGDVIQEKYAYLPDELDFENVKQINTENNMTKEESETLAECLKKRYDELESERKAREEEYKLRQKYCNHVWGPVTWTWSCGGYRTCKICGAVEDYYERD